MRKSSASNRQLVQIMAGTTVIVIALIPFHALLTVWLSSLVGHYTALRLWKEGLLLLLTLGAVYLVVQDPTLRRWLRRWRLVWVIAAFCLVQLVRGIIAFALHDVGAKALAYGWLVDMRYLVFFVDTVVIVSRAALPKRLWQKAVFWPASAVVAFGLLQYLVLPYDFLRHFGYSAVTIFPYEDINNNVHYIRVMSTLRGANPLGSYLVVVLCLLATAGFAWARTPRVAQTRWHKLAISLLASGAVVALVLTFSRAAWLGTVFALAVLVAMQLPSRLRVRVVAAGILVAGMLAGATLLLWHDTTFQNVVFHTQEHSLVKTTSDQGHASALQVGVRDMVHEPLGRGPGTAGPASVYNTDHPVRIAEDYFIQIAQESGWLGLALFLAVIILVAAELWHRSADALALGLFAALAGICVVSLLSHAWADDTLAYLWWGLAGIALAPSVASSQDVIDVEAVKR